VREIERGGERDRGVVIESIREEEKDIRLTRKWQRMIYEHGPASPPPSSLPPPPLLAPPSRQVQGEGSVGRGELAGGKQCPPPPRECVYTISGLFPIVFPFSCLARAQRRKKSIPPWDFFRRPFSLSSFGFHCLLLLFLLLLRYFKPR
jgi:hypothetical protein